MTYKTGLEDCYVIKNNKKMRLGYTTGSCAAAAASGAAQILLGGKTITEVSLMTPKGILLHLKLEDITVKELLLWKRCPDISRCVYRSMAVRVLAE